MCNKENKLNCNICGNTLSLSFNYNKEYNFYKCKNCGFLKRYPDDIIIDYSIEYMRSELITKSRTLANNYYKRLKSFIEPNSKVLEFGGSFGFFCKLLKDKKNCELYNIETSKFASEYSNKIGVKTFENLIEIDKNNRFDYIFSFHVIEHLYPNDIKKHIISLLEILKPKGKIIIFTPNGDSNKIYLLKKFYPWLAFPEHISFLTPSAAKLLFVQ